MNVTPFNPQPWAADPALPCVPPAGSTETEVQAHADKWIPSTSVVEDRSRNLCDGCPALNQCLTWALDFRDPFTGGHMEGIFGGTTTNDRTQLRAGRNGAAA